MPMHDWTKVYAGIFHSFHQAWVSVIAKRLNMGRLPQNLYALAEQQTQKEKQKRYVPDILTLESSQDSGGVMTAPRLKKPKPKAMIESYSELEIYRRKKSVIGIRHVSHHRLVAVLEIVSPGNKSGRKPLAELVRKTAAMLNKGIHCSLIDPFPPGPYDRDGIHSAIWDELTDELFTLPRGKNLTSIAYESTVLRVNAYVNPFSVGDKLLDLPVYIAEGDYVEVPLEETYMEAWEAHPKYWRDVIEGKRLHVGLETN